MLGYNPHLHILAADGAFCGSGTFYTAAAELDASTLEPLFMHKILSMLKKRGLIGDRVHRANMLMTQLKVLMYTQVAGFIQDLPSPWKIFPDTL